MNEQTAERWLVTSALVVGGTYAFLKWKGKTTTSVGTFATAWGCVYLVLALMTEASPAFGGAFSILVMSGDLLANLPHLTSTAGISTTLGGSVSPPSTSSSKNTGQGINTAANSRTVNSG